MCSQVIRRYVYPKNILLNSKCQVYGLFFQLSILKKRVFMLFLYFSTH